MMTRRFSAEDKRRQRCYDIMRFSADLIYSKNYLIFLKPVRTDSTAKMRFHFFHSHFFVTQKTSTAKSFFWDRYTKFRGFFSKGGGLFVREGDMVSHGDSTVK